jgi:SAM-dependent methyltransferase
MAQPAPLEKVRASYEQLYAGVGLAGDARLYRRIVRLLAPRPGGTLLDVACGEGGLVREALRHGLAAQGLDIARAAIETARRLTPEGRFEVGDAAKLPYPSASFDYVTCLGSLENMPDPWASLAEIRRVAKDDARICVMVPNAFWLGDVLSAWLRQRDDRPFQVHDRRASRDNWRGFLRAGGFTVERELRHNRPAVLFRGGKLRSVRKFLVRSARNLVTPFNLSLEFIYLCRKAASAAEGQHDYWLWEAWQSWIKKPEG